MLLLPFLISSVSFSTTMRSSPGPGSRVVHVGGSEISVLLVGRGYYVLKSPYAIPTGSTRIVRSLRTRSGGENVKWKRGILRLNDHTNLPYIMNKLNFMTDYYYIL